MRKRKFYKARNPRRIILVICEGETEAAYVDMLRKHYRLPITIKSKIVGNRVNNRMVKQILTEEGLLNESDSHVVYMYDSDIVATVEKLKLLKGTLILSNPCIELWFLLHLQNHSRPVNSREILKILEDSSPVWFSYTKGTLTNKQKEILLERRSEAIERAKLLSFEGNPSTNMYQFLEILESEKKA